MCYRNGLGNHSPSIYVVVKTTHHFGHSSFSVLMAFDWEDDAQKFKKSLEDETDCYTSYEIHECQLR